MKHTVTSILTVDVCTRHFGILQTKELHFLNFSATCTIIVILGVVAVVNNSYYESLAVN